MTKTITPAMEIISKLNKIIGNLKFGEKFFLRNIIITPVYLQIDFTLEKDFLTLDESIEKKYSIKIKDVSDINRVQIENNTNRSLFVMDGEQLTGGLQNRMFVHSFVLEPQRKANYDVYCIEAGRWGGNARLFNTQKDLSYTRVRLLNLISTRTNAKDSQDIIWREIKNKSETLNYYSKTSSLTDLNRFMDRIADDYIENYKYSGENGYIVQYDDNIVSFEILNENSIVQKLYKKMMKSYIYDAIGIEEENLQKIKNFDKEIENLNVSTFRESKNEQEFHIFNNRLEGKVYSNKDGVFHISLFNNRKITK